MSRLNRRTFVAASTGVLAGTLAGRGLSVAAGTLAEEPVYRTKLFKAMIGTPDEATLKSLKEAGFDGIESNQRHAPVDEAAAARKSAESLGLRVHSVLYGWANFNTDSVAADIESVAKSLETAAAYGADALLLVPCRIGGMAMPKPWEFDIEFDEKTGHVVKVVAGDNAPYRDYIEAHNHAVDTSREAVKKLIPAAEKTKVIIALENVWNNLWVQPAIFAHFVKSFDHPLVKAYYDIGNHVRYAPPREWLRALGKEIVKLHVKDFLLNPDGHDGKFVHPRDGSVNWPEVRNEIEKIGYNGFMTIEDGGLSLEEFSRRLDLIIAGE
ncbi:MAG: sugar phosphate isomerase/epimerase [Thermogutta sp.]|nr:sugar phosphate isomerase/epimerase [Thermogutta sp.]